MKINEITSKIEAHSNEIVASLTQRDVQFYQFIKNELKRTNVAENLIFQLVYSKFYTLDNRKLSPEFKLEYFRIMEELKSNETIDLETILFKLHDIPLRDSFKFHFSFASKLAHTLDENVPIWDSQIAKMFSFKRPIGDDWAKIADDFIDQIENIQSAYKEIITNNLLEKSLKAFDDKFKGNDISTYKKIDFIFWSAGKLDIKLR
jgi:hypothetical protein